MKTSWVMTAEVKSGQLHHPATIRSKKIDLFAPKCKKAVPKKTTFDVLDMSDSVEKCFNQINVASGWAIFGRVEPTETASETTNYD